MKKMGFLDMFKYLPILALTVGILTVFLADDSYRYPCQDPVNWGTPDCEPPICNASGTCTLNLITLDGSPVTSEQLSAIVSEIEASQNAVGIKGQAPQVSETPLYEEVQ